MVKVHTPAYCYVGVIIYFCRQLFACGFVFHVLLTLIVYGIQLLNSAPDGASLILVLFMIPNSFFNICIWHQNTNFRSLYINTKYARDYNLGGNEQF